MEQTKLSEPAIALSPEEVASRRGMRWYKAAPIAPKEVVYSTYIKVINKLLTRGSAVTDNGEGGLYASIPVEVILKQTLADLGDLGYYRSFRQYRLPDAEFEDKVLRGFRAAGWTVDFEDDNLIVYPAPIEQ